MNNNCPVLACSSQKNRRYILCSKCWVKLPLNLQVSTRELPKGGKNDKANQQTLRAVPEPSWLEQATKYVGPIKKIMTWGHGINAVKIKD